MHYHEGLAEPERGLLVAALIDRSNDAKAEGREDSPGIKKCASSRRTPMSLQLELFARAASRVG